MESKVSNLVVYYSFNVHSRLFIAQEVIKGFVKDGNDEPLPGVSVAVKGATNVGTITNVDGKYSINAHKNDVLVFSYIGMVSQEVKVGNKTNINITLKEDVSSLDEIVVVGYGTQKRGSLTRRHIYCLR